VGANFIETRPFHFFVINRSSVCPLILQLLLLSAVALGQVKLPLEIHVIFVNFQIKLLFASFLTRLCL